MCDRGFSLVELLVALIVFSIIMLGIASSSALSTRTNRDSQRQAVAVNLAHQVLECVKSQIQAGRTSAFASALTDCNPSSVPAGFTISGVTATPDSPIASMTRIQITIQWTSPQADLITFDWLVDT
jgi:prepilin-type N-terminal cleavage/methylation domain-containing protein